MRRGKRKKTIYELMKEYGIPEEIARKGRAALRYRTPPEKGIAWYWLSQYVRHRDVYKYGTCVYCGREITVKNSDAAHFIPASSQHAAVTFTPENVHASCKYCNRYNPNFVKFERTLIERYGKDFVEDLKNKYFTKKYTHQYYFSSLAKKMRKATEELIKQYEGEGLSEDIQ